jgi:hypothetical protein
VNGYKTVENRTWRTNHRGLLAIHASLTVDQGELQRLLRFRREHNLATPPCTLAAMQRGGAIVGIVDLIDCTQTPETAQDRRWYAPDSWAWVLRNPRVITPQFVKGRLGLWEAQV